MGRPVILVLIDYYLPGFKAGGPVRSLSNMVATLSDEFEFRVVTRDRDLRETEAYEGVEPGRWSDAGDAKVLYLPPGPGRVSGIANVLRSVPHDICYQNSLFSPCSGILPLVLRRLRRARGGPVILAPRGELSPGSLSKKAPKKRAYLTSAKILRLHAGLLWHASSAQEKQYIFREFGGRARVHVAQNLTGASRPAPPPRQGSRSKAPGELAIAYVGRISREKNLLGALEYVRELRGKVRLDIYGVVDEQRYWEDCRKKMESLPSNVSATHHGPAPHEKVLEAMESHQILLLPSWGENFGHVIAEALLAGCPVVISDRTPWRDLAAAGVGWDLPLEDASRFRETLQHCVGLDREEFSAMSERARTYAQEALAAGEAVEQNRQLFRLALQ